MADMNELADMLRKMAEMGGDMDKTSKKIDSLLDIILDVPTRVAQHDALIRQSFLSVMIFVMKTMGAKNADHAQVALEHLRKCMDVCIENHKWKDTTKIPSASIYWVMRPMTDPDDND